MSTLPEVKLVGGMPTLLVDGKPFLALGGEVHNSSASDPNYMLENVWPNLEGMHLNSLILPVTWEEIEPEEGSFDFSTIDAVVAQARERGYRLTLLWFGLWKNGSSMYVPGWVKRDPETYFTCKMIDGADYYTISPFCEAAVEKDKNAFVHLMAHLRETDPDHTVIVMQVENEIGFHGNRPGSERDYGEAATAIFNREVPEILKEKLGVSGTWTEAFGDDAAESLMAYGYASAVEKIASAGKRELDLPCYVNSWLEQPPYRAGMGHPSGGPICRMHPIWRAAAPSLFGFGPDIYVPYVANVMDAYSKNGNPLFIPEIRKDAASATFALYAVAGCNALCFSPFGIEDINMPESRKEPIPMAVMMMLEIDPAAFDTTGTAEALGTAYRMLRNLYPLLLEKRGTRQLQAFIYRDDDIRQHICKFSNYDILVKFSKSAASKPGSGGFIVELGEDEFLLVGTRLNFSFLPKAGENVKVELERYEEGEWYDGAWHRGRILNGDERGAPHTKELPSQYYLKLNKR